jgi:gamma-glutamyl-gamma-aminobutyrate hydrolase PuuD
MTVIGIAACRKLEDYRQSILHVGAEPRVLDLSMPVEQALAGIDGLLLTGGADVAPSLYGEVAHPTSSRSHSSPRRVSATCRSSRSAAGCRS